MALTIRRLKDDQISECAFRWRCAAVNVRTGAHPTSSMARQALNDRKPPGRYWKIAQASKLAQPTSAS